LKITLIILKIIKKVKKILCIVIQNLYCHTKLNKKPFLMFCMTGKIFKKIYGQGKKELIDWWHRNQTPIQ
jgi:hypothetical protein